MFRCSRLSSSPVPPTISLLLCAFPRRESLRSIFACANCVCTPERNVKIVYVHVRFLLVWQIVRLPFHTFVLRICTQQPVSDLSCGCLQAVQSSGLCIVFFFFVVYNQSDIFMSPPDQSILNRMHADMVTVASRMRL